VVWYVSTTSILIWLLLTEMFTITYQTPYNNCEWRQQTFRTLDEALRMIDFYQSCGSPAKLINWNHAFNSCSGHCHHWYKHWDQCHSKCNTNARHEDGAILFASSSWCILRWCMCQVLVKQTWITILLLFCWWSLLLVSLCCVLLWGWKSTPEILGGDNLTTVH